MDVPQERTGENSSKRSRLDDDTGDAERAEDICARNQMIRLLHERIKELVSVRQSSPHKL